MIRVSKNLSLRPRRSDPAPICSSSVRDYGAQADLEQVSRAIRLGNGRIIVLDLLKHNVEEARKLYADHWLGFREVRLQELLERSDFRDIEVSVD
jgi:hypothetical protein